MTTGAEKQNAKDFPSVFYCRHMFPGLAGYENETILINADAMKRMIPSGEGRPIYVKHQKVDLENIKQEADGYLGSSFYNELDGWAWFKMIVVGDDAKTKIAEGWSVSNAYVPNEFGMSGEFQGCKYDREILNGAFTHLAIVKNPRYEGACIYTPDEFKLYQDNKRRELAELQNSKTTDKGKPIMNFFKMKKEKVTEIDADTLVEIKNEKGETVEVSVSDMTAAVLNAKKNSDDEKKKDDDEKMNEDTEVSVGDEKMPLKELISRYNSLSNKKNSDDSDDDKKKKDDETKNESDDDKKKDDKSGDEKKNDKGGDDKKHFEELQNANRNPKDDVVTIDTSARQMQRGNDRYGSAK